MRLNNSLSNGINVSNVSGGREEVGEVSNNGDQAVDIRKIRIFQIEKPA